MTEEDFIKSVIMIGKTFGFEVDIDFETHNINLDGPEEKQIDCMDAIIAFINNVGDNIMMDEDECIVTFIDDKECSGGGECTCEKSVDCITIGGVAYLK
jgi:hypothetical protein